MSVVNITDDARTPGYYPTQSKNVMLGVRGGGCAGFVYDWHQWKLSRK